MIRKKIIFTDLDRTLLTDDDKITANVLKAMEKAIAKNYFLAIATGRNIFSAQKVLSEKLPFHYLIFSSGAGIIDWKKKEIIYENHLEDKQTKKVIDILLQNEVDFMVHEIIPDNHKFYYWSHHDLPDFRRRIKLYRDFAQPLELPEAPSKVAQILAVLKEKEFTKFQNIQKQLPYVKVIRATSPLDHSSIWLEVFPKNVSKGKTAKWLCKSLQISQKNTIGIGNDYNDIDLLEWTAKSFIVKNAPQELQQKYQVVPSNQADGFAAVIRKIL